MPTTDVYEIGQLLVSRGRFDQKKWRTFHCRCARRVWRYLTAEARLAVEVAEAYANGDKSAGELNFQHERMRLASDVAWRKVDSLKEQTDQFNALWPLSDEVDEAWSTYLSAEVAKVATQNVIEAHSIPDSASSLRAWATARREAASRFKLTKSEPRQAIEKQWKTIRDLEEAEQAQVLRNLFASSPD